MNNKDNKIAKLEKEIEALRQRLILKNSIVNTIYGKSLELNLQSELNRQKAIWRLLKKWAEENAFDNYKDGDDIHYINWCIRYKDLIDKMEELEKEN